MIHQIKIIENYTNNRNRNEYQQFIAKIFPSISFREWYARGFWTDNYRSYSIVKSAQIISNVSASLMDIIISGKEYRALQIGAVGTLPEYRNQGLSRYLMNYVINKYKNNVDLFFLFANDSVMEFYPKFGFRGFIENVFVAHSKIPQPDYSARKLDITQGDDYSLLIDLIEKRQCITKIFGAENYGFITMWHVLNLYSDNIYYLKEEHTIFIIKEEGTCLHVLDIIFKKPFDLKNALAKIMRSDSIKSIRYYFPPDMIDYNFDELASDETGLFIFGDTKLPKIPFRFPSTAVT